MWEGTGFSREPGCSALERCFKSARRAGRSVAAEEGSARFSDVSTRCSGLLSQAPNSLLPWEGRSGSNRSASLCVSSPVELLCRVFCCCCSFWFSFLNEGLLWTD